MDCSPPGSSVHGILQTRIVVSVAMPSSRGSSWPRDWTLWSTWNGRWVFFFFNHQRCLGNPVMPYVLIPSTWISELAAWSAWHTRWIYVLPLDSFFLVSVIADGYAIQNPLQCSCLENPRDGGAWWAAVYGVAQSRTRLKRLSSSSSSMQYRRPGFDPWVRKIPWRKKWQPTPAFLPGESHGQRSLVGYSPWGHKELDTTEWLHSL